MHGLCDSVKAWRPQQCDTQTRILERQAWVLHSGNNVYKEKPGPS